MSFEIQVFFHIFFHILFTFYNNFFFLSLDHQTYRPGPCPLYLHIEKGIYKAMSWPTSGISLILSMKSGMGLGFLTNIWHFIHPPPSAQLVMYPIGDRNLHLVSCLFPHMDMLSSLVRSTLLTMVYLVYEKGQKTVKFYDFNGYWQHFCVESDASSFYFRAPLSRKMRKLSLMDTIIEIPICQFHHKLHSLALTTSFNTHCRKKKKL